MLLNPAFAGVIVTIVCPVSWPEVSQKAQSSALVALVFVVELCVAASSRRLQHERVMATEKKQSSGGRWK